MGATEELAMPTSTLPNGLSVKHVSTQDLRFLYEEVFVQKCYLQHGLQLRPGDTVLDIGAHKGAHSHLAYAKHCRTLRLNQAASRSSQNSMQCRLQYWDVCHGGC
jgi:cyclopropane fatty-acyl-phospholipid synthase-like methyltransferase